MCPTSPDRRFRLSLNMLTSAYVMDIGYDHLCIYIEGILSKTASYLTKHMRNA